MLYVAAAPDAPKQRPSAAHGKLIPVDASGEIELTEEEADGLVHGQVPLFQGKPDPIGGAEMREKKTREEAAAKAAEEARAKAEYDEFLAFKTAKAAKKK